MHGQFNQDLERPSGDKGKSLAWLCRSTLKGEMENLLIAAWDQAPNTCYHQRNIMKQPSESKCRMCYKAEEHSKNIVVGCSTLALSKYTNGLNKVVGCIHWMICKHIGLQVTDKYYERIPERAINVNGTSINWDVLVITDWKILTNWPYTVLHDKKEKTCLLIVIAIPDDSNVNTKETEKLSKY